MAKPLIRRGSTLRSVPGSIATIDRPRSAVGKTAAATHPKILRALGYARVSSREQALGTSLDDQKNRLEAEAKKRGLRKVDRCFDEAESAIYEKMERREQMMQLMATAQPGDLVLCDKVDRWSRDPEVTYRTMRQLNERGVKIYFVDEGIDPSTPEGDSMLNMRVLMAKEEHKRLRLRTQGTRALLRNQGLYVEGSIPIGLQRPDHPKDRIDANILIPSPDAPIIIDFFKRAAKGWTIAQLVTYAQEKYPGRRWAENKIHPLLRNRVYMGEIKSTDGTWIKGRHAPLVSPELFAQVQQGFAERRTRGNKPLSESRTNEWLLRAFARCLQCGRRMGAVYGYGARGPGIQNDYYACHGKCSARHVRVDAADADVGAQALARLVELRKELAAPPKKESKAEGPAVDFAQARAALTKKRDTLNDMRIEGNVTLEDYHGRMGKLDAQRAKLDAAERAAGLAKRSPLQDEKRRRAALERIAEIEKRWASRTVAQRRAILHSLATSVRIERDKRSVVAWRTAAELADEKIST
jgi:DNA invertase Pin-like site-specific DNA recombinase